MNRDNAENSQDGNLNNKQEKHAMNSKTLTAIVIALGLTAAQPARAQQGAQTVGVPVSYELPSDGPLPRTYRVTLAITAPDNPDWIISQFACGVVRTVTPENQGEFSETWNGLDDNYMPLPPGSYGVKGIYMPATKWKITGEYHSLIPNLVLGAGDSWFPTREQDHKYPWLWGAGDGPMMDISVAPADSGRNGIAAIYHNYIENSTNPFLLDLNKPIGYDQILASYGSGGAAGGWATATDGELVWCLCDNGGIPFVYRADGKRFGAGRATVQRPGHYDEQAFMSPGKLALWTDPQGQDRLLVVETSGPNRMSEWTTDGKLLRQWFCGNWAADGGYCADPEKPEEIYTTTVGAATLKGLIRYRADYDKGTWTVDAVWPDICRQDGQFPGGAFRPRIVNLQGHKYLVFARTAHNTFGVMVYRRQGDDWVPSAALIPGQTPKDKNAAFWWHDANGDGQLQPEEYQDNPTTLPGHLRYWGEQWLDDLSFVKLQAGTPDAWRIAPSGFDKFGNPVYDGKGWKKLLTDTVYAARKAGAADALHGANELESAFGGDWQMIDGSMQEGFTVNARGGPGFDANFAAQYKISRYVPDGKGGFRLKWRVGRTAFGTAQPGQMYGCIFITKPVNGLVGVHDSTAGLYHVYSEDGLFVDTLFADGNRFRPNQAGAYLLQGENFSGTHFLHRTNGKVYVAMASNQPCTLFEIDGWGKSQSPVRPLTTVDKQVSIAAAQIAPPPEIALKVRGGAGAAHVARFLPAPGGGPVLDGSLNGWEGCDPVKFRSEEKQSVEVRCMYDPGQLYLRWHARFAGKFAPQPLAPAEYIFTHGRAADTVSFYLQGDPNAKPGGPAEGRPGDVRIVFGVFQDGDRLRPVALGLYPKWFGPGGANPLNYGSAVTPAKFEHVGPIVGAKLGYALDDDGQGWTLAASLPKAAFPKLPEFSGHLRTLANFEATFGGHNKFWWANSDGSANKTTWDEPTEARLYPGSWASAQWVGLEQMYVHSWNIVGPFGFAGLPALDHSDSRPKICETLANAKYPPEVRVDLAASYTGDMTQTRVKTRTLKWKQIAEPGNLLDFGKQLGWGYPDEGAAYAVTYLYSPAAVSVRLRLEDGHGHHAIRGWLNGRPLPLDPQSLPVTKLACRIDGTQPVNLQAGWNELLVRFDFIWGDKTLGLRLDAKPEQLWGLRISATPPSDTKK